MVNFCLKRQKLENQIRKINPTLTSFHDILNPGMLATETQL